MEKLIHSCGECGHIRNDEHDLCPAHPNAPIRVEELRYPDRSAAARMAIDAYAQWNAAPKIY